jgi:hypothetical protein
VSKGRTTTKRHVNQRKKCHEFAQIIGKIREVSRFSDPKDEETGPISAVSYLQRTKTSCALPCKNASRTELSQTGFAQLFDNCHIFRRHLSTICVFS